MGLASSSSAKTRLVSRLEAIKSENLNTPWPQPSKRTTMSYSTERHPNRTNHESLQRSRLAWERRRSWSGAVMLILNLSTVTFF